MQIKGYGIDTSKWQASKVDYAKAKTCGISFVFLRIGNNKTLDPCFERDYAAAVAAGLKVGVYFYTLSQTVEEAYMDATRVLGWLNNRHLDFPVVFDLEDKKQKDTGKKNINSKMYNAFKDKIESYGIYDAMLYTGENFFNNYFNKSLIDDDIWIAKYSITEPYVNRNISIWQYSSEPVDTPYFKGKLDVNYLLVDKFQGSKEKIANETINPYPVPTRTLKKTIPCMKGNDVKWLQFELNFIGKDLDGIFGQQTLEAVKQIQKKYGLKVDGIVGPATRYALLNN